MFEMNAMPLGPPAVKFVVPPSLPPLVELSRAVTAAVTLGTAFPNWSLTCTTGTGENETPAGCGELIGASNTSCVAAAGEIVKELEFIGVAGPAAVARSALTP